MQLPSLGMHTVVNSRSVSVTPSETRWAVSFQVIS
jgi:hypothetical protein